MFATRRTAALVSVATLFAVTSVACSVGGWFSRLGVETPDRPVVVSQEAAAQAASMVRESQAGTTIRMSEAQFTSFLVSQMAQGGGETPLQDLTVWFEPGRLVLQGQLQEGVLPMSGRLVLSGSLSAQDGVVQFAVDQASVSGIRLPGAVVDQLNQQIDRAIAQAGFGAGIQSVVLEEGALVIQR